MRRASVAVVGLLALLTATTVAVDQLPPGPGDEGYRTGIKLERFTGPVERHCGIYRLSDRAATKTTAAGATVAADRATIRVALRCVARARKLRQGAWAIWEVRDLNRQATEFRGFAVTPDSDIHLVIARPSPEEPMLTPCLEPWVEKDLTTRCDNQPRPVDASGVERWLKALARDVERTTGRAHDDVMAATRRQAQSLPLPATAVALSGVAFDAQLALEAEGAPNWPLCPLHNDHALDHREHRWFCTRYAVFVAELGRLPKPRQPERP